MRIAALSRIVLAVLSMGLVPATTHAQDEAALKRALEGRDVTVLLDMPASHKGVDLYLQREPEMKVSDHAARLAQFGAALREGDRSTITRIKVNKKNIEVHLGAGGYGTWGHDSGSVSPEFVPKSDRERDLEKERKRTTDSRRKREIDRELSRLCEIRQREERLNKREAEIEESYKKAEIADKRLSYGSRFNIWYADARLEMWAPTPEELMQSLSAYLDFGDDRHGDGIPGVRRGTAGSRLAPLAVDPVQSLRRGMSRDGVHDLLGAPTRRRTTRQGDLDSTIETWETSDSVTEVTFVADVVVKFTTSSR